MGWADWLGGLAGLGCNHARVWAKLGEGTELDLLLLLLLHSLTWGLNKPIYTDGLQSASQKTLKLQSREVETESIASM